MSITALLDLDENFSLPAGPSIQIDGRLFMGFSPEILQTITGNRGRVIADLSDMGGDIQEIFIGSQVAPARSRSMFVANPTERDVLSRHGYLPPDLKSVVFPDSPPPDQDAETTEKILRDKNIRVVCFNTAWPALAVQRWLDTAINNKPNRGRVGIIGLGNIGENVCNAMVSDASVLARSGMEPPLKGINVMRDPRSDFDARILEARHISNTAGLKISTFDESELDDFYKRSDIVLFIVSKSVPQLGDEGAVGDVRMTQFSSNLKELRNYIRKAEEGGFRGTFIIVSDPPEHLATALHNELKERVNFGERSDVILGTHQIIANAGVLNFARASHVIGEVEKQDKQGLSDKFRHHGYVFGAHGRLLVANDVRRGEYDPTLSRTLSKRTSRQNIEVRALGKLPFTAPGHNLALSMFDLLAHRSAPVSLGIDGAVFGVRAALHDVGAFEIIPFDGADPRLVRQVLDVHNYIRGTTETASHQPVENTMPLRPTAFWANGVITGEALMTKINPICSGRDISSWNATIVERHHFPLQQGNIYIPNSPKLKSLVDDTMVCLGGDYLYEIDSETGREEEVNESISSRQLLTGAGIVSVKKIQNPAKFNLGLYEKRFPLYLQIDIEVDNPSATAFISRIEAQGGILIGFTPRTHGSAPVIHFCFIGDRVGVDSEFPCLPLRSSMTGFDGAMNHLSHWQNGILPGIRKRVLSGYGLSPDDKPHPSQLAPSLREKVIEEGRNIIDKEPVLRNLLNELGHYQEAPSLYEHIVYVKYTASQLITILGIEDHVDKEMVERMALLHDLGKAVYLRLSHFCNALMLQKKINNGDGIRPLSQEELGDPSNNWRYGQFKALLLNGTPIELPESLSAFADFIDMETGVITSDTEISKRILADSDIKERDPELFENMRRFFSNDNSYDTDDVYILLLELADNLSDYGRINDLPDIIKYLGYKEAYAIKRYGNEQKIADAITAKFDSLREEVIKLYQRTHPGTY